MSCVTVSHDTVTVSFVTVGHDTVTVSCVAVGHDAVTVSCIVCRVLQWVTIPLADNDPTHAYGYNVSVLTGLRPHAGTTSNVCLILAGDHGDTGMRLLGDGKRKVRLDTRLFAKFIPTVT